MSFSDRVQYLYDQICKSIQVSAEAGETKAYIASDDLLTEIALEKLKDDGFQIERTSGSMYNVAIHW